MILFIDLDYTLLNSQGKLTERTVKTLKKVKEAGHIIVLNSARSLSRTVLIGQQFGYDYCNCFYGGMVVDNNGNVIYERVLPSENLAKIAKEMENVEKCEQYVMCIESSDKAYGNHPIMPSFKMDICKTPEELFSHKAYKFIFKQSQTPEIMEKTKAIAEKYNLDVKFAREGWFCTFLPKNADKVNGVRVLLDMLNKEHGPSVAFGDEIGDLKTFEVVDIAVPVANSTSDVTSRFPVATLSNDEDGCAVWIEANILKEKTNSLQNYHNK